MDLNPSVGDDDHQFDYESNHNDSHLDDTNSARNIDSIGDNLEFAIDDGQDQDVQKGSLDVFFDVISDVSISMTVLLLFTPLRQVMKTKCFHPCFVEHLNYNIPKSGRIHSMINSLCDNVFQIQIDEFNSFGLAAIGYDLYFFQDRILDDVGDDFKLILTERARDKGRHEIGLRFKIDGCDTEYEDQHATLASFFADNVEAFQMHLVTVPDLVRFRELLGLDSFSSEFNPRDSFQNCYLKTLLDFQEFTRWRFAAMNGQNRLSAALSFMIGCNYSLHDWRLKSCSIDPWKTLDDSGLVDLTDDSIKEYKIYGQVVGMVPSHQVFLDHINRARVKSTFTSGVRFNPSLEIRVISHDLSKIECPSITGFLQCLKEFSRKRALDERMLSNTSMPAKCAQIMQIIGEEIALSFKQCLEFYQNYKAPPSKRSQSFTTKFHDYKSESDDEGTQSVIHLSFYLYSFSYVSFGFL